MEVGVLEAKNRFSELIERAERGEPVTITRHGTAVATLNPVKRRPTRAEVEEIIQQVREDRRSLPPITREELRRDREAGWDE